MKKSNYVVPKGTRDYIYPETCRRRSIENTARSLFGLHNFKEIETPIFEHTELFVRGIGEGTDIVEKEMFTLVDQQSRSITLRPEGTAGVVRSFVEFSLLSNPYMRRVYYIGPMFRKERPQSGRMRQFQQIGLEMFGYGAPEADYEVISIFTKFFTMLGLKNLVLKVNTMGCRKCRLDYLPVLKSYLSRNIDALCDNCKERVVKNILRVFDCKNEKCVGIINEAPVLRSFLCDECSDHFAAVLGYLERFKIPFRIEDRLVRGFDYYTRTNFEMVYGKLGAQNAVGGGGRYDYLIADLGGPDLPALGFAIGLERTMLALERQGISIVEEDGLDYLIVVVEKEQMAFSIAIMERIQSLGLSTEIDYSRDSLKSQLRHANNIGASNCIIIGEDEVSNNRLTVKDLRSGEQVQVDVNDLEKIIAGKKKDKQERNC